MIARIQYIHLADDEWGNELMERVARDWFDTHPDVDVIRVYEHAGWYLSFLRDAPDKPQNRLTVVDSANDAAVFSGRAQEYHRQLRGMTAVGSHRRQDDKEAALA